MHALLVWQPEQKINKQTKEKKIMRETEEEEKKTITSCLSDRNVSALK